MQSESISIAKYQWKHSSLLLCHFLLYDWISSFHHLHLLRYKNMIIHLTCKEAYRRKILSIDSIENAVCRKYQGVDPHPVASSSQHSFWAILQHIICATHHLSTRKTSDGTTMCVLINEIACQLVNRILITISILASNNQKTDMIEFSTYLYIILDFV